MSLLFCKFLCLRLFDPEVRKILAWITLLPLAIATGYALLVAVGCLSAYTISPNKWNNRDLCNPVDHPVLFGFITPMYGVLTLMLIAVAIGIIIGVSVFGCWCFFCLRDRYDGAMTDYKEHQQLIANKDEQPLLTTTVDG